MSAHLRLGRIAAAAAAALVLAGCASLVVSSYSAPGSQLTAYRTFGWAPMDTLSTGDPRLDNNPFFHERVRSAIEQQLTAKGFEKAVSGTPDVLLHYHASVTQQIDVRGVDREYGYCEDEDCGPYVHDAGTLVVDVVDARSNDLLWRGWAEDSVDGVIDDQKLLEARIDQAVRRIMERLPRRL